jgi:hypothetical protein
VQQSNQRFGGVDVLVNNAGYGYRAAVEEGDDADVRALFETHFFGTVAMVKAVLPGMRARRSGAIVNISSIGAQLRPVGSGYYAAAKAAIEGLSGALRGELAPLGISVTIVEPGAFRTDFAGRSLTQSATVIDDYAATRPATPRRPAPRSFQPSNHRSRQPFCYSDPTRSPPTATSPTAARTKSQHGKSSRSVRTSTAEDLPANPRYGSPARVTVLLSSRNTAGRRHERLSDGDCRDRRLGLVVSGCRPGRCVRSAAESEADHRERAYPNRGKGKLVKSALARSCGRSPRR